MTEALPALARIAEPLVIAERVNVLIRDYNSGRVDDLATLLTDTRTLQVVSTETGAAATGTTVIPNDDTIPQSGEGNEYMTLAITPKSATSRLVITVTINVASSAAVNAMVAALFQDSTAGALAAAWATTDRANTVACITFTHVMTSGTTSATTFKVRAGGVAAGTTTFNGATGTRRFGGVMASSIVIREELP